MDVYSIIIHINQKVEANSVYWQMNVYLCNGILLSFKKEENSDTH